jgi:hypothetical protein
MEKKNHGLADNQDGEFILNESGTSVSTDDVEGLGIPIKPNVIGDSKKDTEKKSSSGDEEKDFTD